MMPTDTDVVRLLETNYDRDSDLHERVRAALPVVTQMVKAYTRDRGFDANGVPHDDVAAVITTSAARMAQNPHGIEQRSSGIDDATSSERLARFEGWTLAELAVLNRHRKKAM